MASQSRNTTLSLYDRDAHAWAWQQADALRHRRWADVDVSNLADEIEAVAKSEYRALTSALELILMHLLKWQFQPDKRTRSWEITIRVQRRHVARVLRDNPSLKARLSEALADTYENARDLAADETGIEEALVPTLNPFDWHEITIAPIVLD